MRKDNLRIPVGPDGFVPMDFLGGRNDRRSKRAREMDSGKLSGTVLELSRIRFDQPSGVYMMRLDSPYAVESPDGGVGKPPRNAMTPRLDSQHVPRAERAGEGFFDGLSPRGSQKRVENRENSRAAIPPQGSHTNVPWMPVMRLGDEGLPTMGVITDGFDVMGFEHDVGGRGMPASLELDTGNASDNTYRDSGYECVPVNGGCPS